MSEPEVHQKASFMSGSHIRPPTSDMVVGILQFELLIHGAESIKDKRRVVSSVKDRLHREHQVSVAEVAFQDDMRTARLGLALVGTDGKYVGQTLDRITAKLRSLTDAELGDVSREVLHDPKGDPEAPGALPEADPGLDDEMRHEAQRLLDSGEAA
jgi:uncharacterized protein YlxP (DUF503 family)